MRELKRLNGWWNVSRAGSTPCPCDATWHRAGKKQYGVRNLIIVIIVVASIIPAPSHRHLLIADRSLLFSALPLSRRVRCGPPVPSAPGVKAPADQAPID